MKLIIIGAGETGFYIASEFSEGNFEVTLIDQKPYRLRYIRRSLNVAGILGNGTSPSILEKAGIDRADLIIACTDHDETNLICCLLASYYEVKYKIAVTRTSSFLRKKIVSKFLQSGVSQIINSSLVTAQEIIETASLASATEVFAFGEKNVLLAGYKVKRDSPWNGIALKNIRRHSGQNQFLIASIVREGGSFIPDGNSRIREGDYVYILTPRKIADALNDILNEKIYLNRRTIVAGETQVADRVATGLLKSHYSVTMICRNELTLAKMKRRFSSKRMFNGVLGDSEVVKLQLQLDVPMASLFIAASDDDHRNIASSVVAHYLGAKKTICMINRQDLIGPAERAGIDVVISPRLSTARLVKKVIRGGEHALNYTTISETNMEVMELVAGEGSPILGQPLMEVGLPSSTLIGALLKENGKVIIPRGDTVLEPGDKVITVTVPESVPKLKELLEGEKNMENGI